MTSRVQEQPIVQRMGQRARRWFFSIGLVSMALVCGLSSAANISYVYDSLGRVIAVIDPATDTAVYSYDAVGNLTGITRQTSATKSILQFTPSSGPIGTPVTIYGTGFSATPTSNTVKFNGTTATVLTASTTVLTTTVPAGATTGTISVKVAGITATSAASFTVGAGSAPTLSSFSPAVAGYGETVSLTGTNYDTTLINNHVAFTAAIGVVATATTTTITVPVPGSAQTGPISVSTAQGKATSAVEFFVAPSDVVSTDIQYTGRITVNGPTTTASIMTANKNGLMVFDGVAGQRVNLGFSAVTVAAFYATVYRPDGVAMTTAAFYDTGGGSIDLPLLPMTGTYTVFLDLYSIYTGNITVTVSTELAGTVTLGGAAVPLSIVRVGQNARYTFSGTAGQWVSLGLTSVTLTSATVWLLNPDGTTLASTSVGTVGGGLEPPGTLPTTGTYTLVVDPAGIYTGNITLKLMSYLTGALNLDGTATTATLTPVGRNALYMFSGTAGQWVSFGFTGVTIPSATVTLLKPDGTYLTGTTIGTGGSSLDLPTALPTTGTYTLTVNPSEANTGAMTIRLSSEVTGTVTINAAAIPVTIGRAGQNARYTFAGTASQQVTVKITGNTLGSVTVNLYTPSGSYQTGASGAGASFNLPTVTLATTGTYTITLNPSTTATGSLNLKVTTP